MGTMGCVWVLWEVCGYYGKCVGTMGGVWVPWEVCGYYGKCVVIMGGLHVMEIAEWQSKLFEEVDAQRNANEIYDTTSKSKAQWHSRECIKHAKVQPSVSVYGRSPFPHRLDQLFSDAFLPEHQLIKATPKQGL